MITENCSLPVLDMTEKVEDKATIFAGKHPQSDDIILVILRIT